MYVRRLKLHGVKSLWLDVPADGEPLPPASRHRLLLQGGNGSGKTTILDVIRRLWESFGEWIDRDAEPGRFGPPRSLLERDLRAAELAAMELGDFPDVGTHTWIGMGEVDAWYNLMHQFPQSRFAGLSWSKSTPNDFEICLPRPASQWRTFRQRSMVGSEPRVNLVHFPPDNRSGAAAPEDRPKLIDTTQLNWSATYDPKLDLDSLLLTLQALRPRDYDRAVELLNLALQHRDKRLIGFAQNGRLTVEGRSARGTSYHHPVEALSSGERQFLLLIAYTVGFLRLGGIVLIDEPDLHVHIGMVTQLIETLELIVRGRGGQLIAASHSERVWDWFSRDEERVELTPWQGGQP